MPVLKPAIKPFCFILGLFLAGACINSARGNGLQDISRTSLQKHQRDDSLARQKIMNLLQLEIASQTGTSKIQNEYYRDQVYSLANKTGNLDYLCTQLINKGNQERIAAHYPLALSLYSDGLEIAKQLKDTILVTHYYNNIGVVYRKIDDYQNALDYTVKGLHLTTLTHDTLGMAIALNGLGNAQIQLGEYVDAMESFKKSLKLEENRKNKIGLAINLNNIGNVYHSLKKYEKAISYYNLSLGIDREINSRRGIAICYNDLSDVYKDKGDHKKSLEYAYKALDIARKINFTTEEAVAYFGIGENHFKMHSNKEAIENLLEGIRLMRPLGGKAFLEHSYKTLYTIYMEEKDYRKAIKYLNLSKIYHDSLLNLEVQNNIAKLQIQYKTEQKENQITLLDQKARLATVSIKKQRYLIYFLLSAFLLLLIVLGFVILLLHRRRENNRILTLKNKEIEDAREALEINEKELMKAKEEAEQNALAKSQIMADLSHEIRTPLNSVIGFSDLLYKSSEDPKQKKYLKAIGASGRGLLRLINEILNSSKQGKDDLPVEMYDFSLEDCVQEVSNIFALKAEEKNIALDTIFSKTVPRIIHFNKMMLQQILLNLIGNAIKFTEAGYVKVLVSTEEGEEKGLIQLNIEIKDSGVGIPKEEQKQIFKPFHQVDRGVKQEGNGLGLSITEDLVKKMNGTIRLISEKNKGSRFILNFNKVRALPETIAPDLTDSLLANIRKPPFLLLSTNSKIKEEVKTFFDASGFKLWDVGLNLSEARKHFLESPLTILCCLSHDELLNTLSILEKESLKNDHRFLIISKGTEPVAPGTGKTIVSLPKNAKDLSEKLKDFLSSYQEEMLEYILFNSNSRALENDEMRETFNRIFTNEYKEAYSTHMLGSIGKLVDALRDAGDKYGLANLIAFSETMHQNIDHFDTRAIDKRLDILAKAFQRNFGF